MTCNLSFIANTQKLSADWQSSHCLLNLSACVILSNAFAPKKSPLSDSCCSLCCYFSPGVRGEGKKENCFSRHQRVQQPFSHNSLLWTPVEFQRLRRILQMTWIDFSLKRSSTLQMYLQEPMELGEIYNYVPFLETRYLSLAWSLWLMTSLTSTDGVREAVGTSVGAFTG